MCNHDCQGFCHDYFIFFKCFVLSHVTFIMADWLNCELWKFATKLGSNMHTHICVRKKNCFLNKTPLDTLLFKSYVGSNWNTSCTTTQRYWFSDAGPYCSDKSVFLVSNWFSQKKKHATLSNGWANVDLWLSQVIIVSVSS